MSTEPVNNGKRIDVMLADFAGTAGFVEREQGIAQLAYAPNKGGTVGPGTIVTVDGRRWTVAKAERSPYATHLRVLDLVRIA